MAKQERGLRFQPAGGTKAPQVPTGKKQRLRIERLANDGRGTSIFTRSAGLTTGSAGASATGADTIGATTNGSGTSSSSGREGAAKGNSVRGSQLTTCMAVK